MSARSSKQLFAFLFILLCAVSVPATEDENTQILITNVRVFDGKSEKLASGMNVLVENNLIKTISSTPISATAKAAVIKGGGRVLMPGMIDTHTHLALPGGPSEMRDWDWGYLGARMANRAETTLLWGFTTVRDLGGPVAGLKRSIDEGHTAGPRIYPSLAFITQTGGHGDFRNWTDPHPDWFDHASNWEKLGFFRLADGVPDVLASVRENFARGATQIKVMGSGGVGSEYDPIDSVQYTMQELKAIVGAAEDWGTYVGAHLHNADSINRAIDAGLKSIDHGFGVDEKAMKKIVDKGLFLNTHFAWNKVVMKASFLNDFQREKAAEVVSWSDNMVRLIKKYNPKITFCIDAFGEDPLFNTLVKTEFQARAEVFSAIEILRQATSGAAELLALSGKRSPYKAGALGVVEEGAYADLLIVDGNPLEDIMVMAEPEKNLRLIIKDGKVHKNSL